MTSPENIYLVPVKLWNRMNNTQRLIFNESYTAYQATGKVGLLPPSLQDITDDEFDVIAWNAALLAAFDAGKYL